MYPNYMMSVDPFFYYYYTLPEMPQMQEYASMPYQEYVPPIPKDTVYLLFPTHTLQQQPQAPANIVPEWQNRRRRRRYEGYAEYAVIPEKSNSVNREEKEYNKKIGQHANSRRNSSQSTNCKKMTSFDTNKIENTSNSEICSENSTLKDFKKGPFQLSHIKKEKSQSFATKEVDCARMENNHNEIKGLEVCGVHSKNSGEKGDTEPSEKRNSEITVPKNVSNTLHMPQSSSEEANFNAFQALENETFNHVSQKIDNKEDKNTKENLNKVRKLEDKHVHLTNSLEESLENNSKPKVKQTDEFLSQHPLLVTVQNDTTCKSKAENDILENPLSPLPDILRSIHEPAKNQRVNKTDFSPNTSLQFDDTNKEKSLKPKSILSQSCLYNMSSEALQNEMEIELKHLQNLHSLQANQSIYQLAFDENDQSEEESRSSSPVDPESQIPKSLTNSEIVIHEADSGSEAGSEDVELIPHRYESETFLNENKHMYVNKLSLAVELLRTHENLPYDEEFKRVDAENISSIVPVHTRGKVNLGFQDNTISNTTFCLKNNFENSGVNMDKISSGIATQQQNIKHSAHSSDGALFNDIEFDYIDEEASCETAVEVEAQENGIQENTERIRAGYRMFGAQARNYLSPRAALPFNPCFCCIIM